MRRARLSLPLVLALALACGRATPPHPFVEGEPPQQVVLITVGALRADHLRTYGYGPKREVQEAIRRDISSYRIDEIFGPGVVFENAQASASESAPSLATLFTGLLPSKHGVRANGQVLAESVPTIASLFKEAGYATAAFLGAGHLTAVTPGFDEVVARHAHATSVRLEAQRWLNNRRENERFFMWVHFTDVRDWYMSYNPSLWVNYESREEQVRNATKGTPRQIYGYFAHLHGLPEDDGEFEPVDFGWRPDRSGSPATFRAQEPADILDWFDRYDARIANVDLEVRELVQNLEQLGLPGRKLLMFTADHGEALGDHGYVGHDRHLYEAQLRVPLMLRFVDPADPAGVPRGRVAQQVRHTDLFLTMATMLGRDPAEFALQPDGEPLWPLLPGAPAAHEQEPRVAYAERTPVDELRREQGWTEGEVWSVRTPEFRLIVRENGPDELYKMVGRPREAMDLAGRDHPAEDALRELLAERRDWIDAHADELPRPDPPGERWRRELVKLGERR